ncbi:YaaC family protein [Bacillus tianshenii]|uniref:YaaC family protein n=1 Tax=Sutcliffiella tianshenii TaxID=1463404 RepID=UPI001CD4A830|nr:YaaC family protein [Bacillus tianshenii]MCA1322419.1 YaaC family protein [Bacillus tianshenii]
MAHSNLNLFHPFLSVETAQKLLKISYQKRQVENHEQKSYQNAYSFIYFIEHGLTYLQQTKVSPLSIKPVLLFYGMIQLLKACLLTVDPSYPESTAVLAHGVSTRKRKKQSYEFIQDEVKIQKNGLFSHISDKMFHVKQMEGTKYSMQELLYSIPELEAVIKITKNKMPFLPIGLATESTVSIPNSILDDYKMTQDRFIQYFESNTSYKHSGKEQSKQMMTFNGKQENQSLSYSPLLYHHQKSMLYIPRKKEHFTFFPEVLVHYLLLYNLSMICRYETEWWGELLHTFNSSDLSLIIEFLDITAEKTTHYLHSFLTRVFDIED